MTIRIQCILCLFDHNLSGNLATSQGLHEIYIVFDQKKSLWNVYLKWKQNCTKEVSTMLWSPSEEENTLYVLIYYM